MLILRKILQKFSNSYHISLPILLLLLISLPLLLFLYQPHFLSPTRQHPIPSSSDLADFSLFSRATSASASTFTSRGVTTFSRLGSHNPTLKIAFLFLTNSDLYFSPIWEVFFNSTSSEKYNIYIHADPKTRVRDPGGVFSNRFIESKHTERSSATLISAARRLIATAILDDSLNYYFALVSQSCIPVHSFGFVYRSLFSDRPFKSFIEILSNETTLPSRYVSRGDEVMLPEVPYSKFRVGSQFWILNKKHSLMVLKERKLWRKFRLPCFKVNSCYPEEHYFSTFLDMEVSGECSGYGLTRVNWTGSVDGHPHLYRPGEVTAELVYTLRESSFEKDHLFARKFSPDCLGDLLDLSDNVLFKD